MTETTEKNYRNSSPEPIRSAASRLFREIYLTLWCLIKKLSGCGKIPGTGRTLFFGFIFN